jgi:hypothetical protein
MFEKMVSQLKELIDDMERAKFNIVKEKEDPPKPMQSLTRMSKMYKNVEELKAAETDNSDVDFVNKRISEIFRG